MPDEKGSGRTALLDPRMTHPSDGKRLEMSSPPLTGATGRAIVRQHRADSAAAGRGRGPWLSGSQLHAELQPTPAATSMTETVAHGQPDQAGVVGLCSVRLPGRSHQEASTAARMRSGATIDARPWCVMARDAAAPVRSKHIPA
jgi:hypothetical protein